MDVIVNWFKRFFVTRSLKPDWIILAKTLIEDDLVRLKNKLLRTSSELSQQEQVLKNTRVAKNIQLKIKNGCFGNDELRINNEIIDYCAKAEAYEKIASIISDHLNGYDE